MKAVNGKPKCMFKAQVVKVIDEVLDNTEYDG
jgi:glutaredoxin-related protein